jgi:hypothetical protein
MRRSIGAVAVIRRFRWAINVALALAFWAGIVVLLK